MFLEPSNLQAFQRFFSLMLIYYVYIRNLCVNLWDSSLNHIELYVLSPFQSCSLLWCFLSCLHSTLPTFELPVRIQNVVYLCGGDGKRQWTKNGGVYEGLDPNIQKRMQTSFCEESNNFNFDYLYIKSTIFLYHISIIRLIMKYIFIVNLFGDINVDILFYKIGQTWESMTSLNLKLYFFWDEGCISQLFKADWGCSKGIAVIRTWKWNCLRCECDEFLKNNG